MNSADKTIAVTAAASAGCGLVVLAAPALVALGYVALILPGLILAAMPTIGCYSLAFAAGWFLSRHWHPVAGVVAGLAAMHGVANALPQRINTPTHRYVATAIEQDHLPASPVEMNGVVAIRQDETPWHNSTEAHCDDLCLHLLFHGDADSVVMAPLDLTGPRKPPLMQPRRWSIEKSTDPCPQFERREISRWRGWPPTRIEDGLAERVRERIGNGECLVSEPGDPASAWIVIERSSFELGGDRRDLNRMSLATSPAFGERLVVSRRRGDEVVEVGRQTHAVTRELAMPLHAVPYGFENIAFDWARTSPNPEDYDNVAVLQRMVRFRQEVPAGLSADSLRRALESALRDPTLKRGDPRFDLAARVISDVVKRGMQPHDQDLLLAALRDRRVMDFPHSWDIVPALGVEALELREVLLERLRDLPYEYRYREAANRFDSGSTFMPAGAYREPSALLLSLLEDPARRRWMDRTIVRLADGGKDAVPLLLRIVEDSLAHIDAKSRDRDLFEDTRSAATALCRIGADAASALPTLERMVGTPAAAGLPRGDAWVVTQVRLGRPLESFPRPANVSGPWHQRIRHLVERAECE